MSEGFMLFTLACSFMLTLVVIWISIYGMLDRRIIFVKHYTTVYLDKHLACVYYNELDAHNDYFTTYRKIPVNGTIPCVRDSCGNMDIFSINAVIRYSVLLGIVSLAEFIMAFIDTSDAPLYIMCSLLTFFSTALLLYTFAVKYKHASFAYERTDHEKHRRVCAYHDRHYYHKWWFLPLQLLLLLLFVVSVFDMYYDPDYTAINTAYVECTDVVCPDLVPKAIKYSQLTKVRMDQGVSSFGTGLPISACALETLREQFATASILQQWTHNAMLHMFITLSYIILYIVLLFPMNYVLYLRSRFKLTCIALWLR